jgi:hypothetical protein
VAGENKSLNSVPTTLAEAKQRLQRIQEAAIQQAQQAQPVTGGHPSGQSISSKPTLELKPLSFSTKPAAGSGAAAAAAGASGSMARFGQQGAAGGPASGSTARAGSAEPAGPQTYEISPYKSDHDSDDDQPKKPVPEWAKGNQLRAQLVAQTYVDPDEIFQQHQKTCSLDEVFANGKSKQDLTRRTSSGNWIDDRVTWREELAYKRSMGYL